MCKVFLRLIYTQDTYMPFKISLLERSQETAKLLPDLHMFPGAGTVQYSMRILLLA